jgi:uncharacterized membrane protein YjjP (DUF1212 family)
MENNGVVKELIYVCSLYQKIITDLDNTLDIVVNLSEDEDIIDTIKAVRQENVERLTQVQKLIDLTIERYQIELLDEIDPNITH